MTTPWCLPGPHGATRGDDWLQLSICGEPLVALQQCAARATEAYRPPL